MEKGMSIDVLIGILIPFVGTALGAACVFFLKNQIPALVQKGLLGFASGVMVAASVWSLLIPAIEMSEDMGENGICSGGSGNCRRHGIFTAHGQTGAAPAFRSGKVGRAACPFKKTRCLSLR